MDCGCLKIFLLENDIYVDTITQDTERVLLRLVYVKQKKNRKSRNQHQTKKKENKVSNTHATIRHAQ